MRIKMDSNVEWLSGIKSASFVEPVTVFDPKRPEGIEAPQDRNRDGVPLWVIHCTWLDETAPFVSPESIKVKVASDERPVIPGGASVVFFGGLHMNVNPRRNGGFSVSYVAESFTFDPAPSTKRAAKAGADVPPPPPAAVKS